MQLGSLMPAVEMAKKKVPLNITLMELTSEKLAYLRPVTTLDIFDGPGGNFHQDGLFSTTTFGRVGDPLRNRRFGYIKLNIPILHPVIYQTVLKLNGLYGDILAGRAYATWDKETKNFVSSNPLDGETGYAFFIRHWHEIEFKETGSAVRSVRIQKVNKYRRQSLIDHLLVMPAGLREADIGVDGRVSMDEINEFYQGVLMLTRNLPDKIRTGDDLAMYDRTRHTLTLRVLEIYKYIEQLVSGKKGFIQGRWASRRIFNSTRNVLSSLDVSAADLSKPNRPGFRSTVMGLNQVTKNVLPKAMFYLKTSVIGDIFDTSSNQVELVDKKTLKRTWVEVSNDEIDQYTTTEGLEQLISDLSVVEKRDRPLEVAGHYVALVYVDDKQHYRILRSIDEVPEGFDRKWVRPITLIELVYLSGVDHWNTFPQFITRYPVENMLSSVPCRTYVKTTERGEMRYRLDADWNVEKKNGLALEYPVLIPGQKSHYHDSLSVPVTILKPLGAD